MLWCRVAPEVGPWISCLEWATFSCTHTLGAGWKFDFGNAPGWVLRVMANGFYTAIGAWGIAGLHCLPLLIYLQGHMVAFDHALQLLPAIGLAPEQTQATAVVRSSRTADGTPRCFLALGNTATSKSLICICCPLQVVLEYGWWVLAAGRALVMTVELWFVWVHIKWMCEGSDEPEASSKAKTKKRSGSPSASKAKSK